MWSAAQREKKLYGFDVHAGFEGNHRSVDKQLANSARWYVYVLKREDGHILRRAIVFEVDSQRKKGRP